MADDAWVLNAAPVDKVFVGLEEIVGGFIATDLVVVCRDEIW